MCRFLGRERICSLFENKTNVDAKYYCFSGAVVSDIGSVRTNNEDNYILGQYINRSASDHSEMTVDVCGTYGEWQLAGVFDGIGGGEAGELASHDTAEIFLSASQKITNLKNKEDVDLAIRTAFLEANNRIIDLRKDYRVGGTTGTVLCTNGYEVKIYHLGDSRAYLVRDDNCLQLTEDQTLAQMKLKAGLYREDDPNVLANRHKLLEYIGKDSTKKQLKPLESCWIPIKLGDNILLCSDGLYDMCSNNEIIDVFRRSSSVMDKSKKLVQMAIFHGGEDNITCVVVTFAE